MQAKLKRQTGRKPRAKRKRPAFPTLGKAPGVILYHGPSAYNGAPIAVVLTLKVSDNPKTGDMAQVYILSATAHPVTAQANGRDASVCGSCPLRPLLAKRKGRGAPRCYVSTFQAPASVYGAYRRGSYATLPLESLEDTGALALLRKRLRGRAVRWGAYGDPAAIPSGTVQRISRALSSAGASGHTAYSHGWRSRPDLQSLAMASVDSLEELREAQAQGWRTFRVAPLEGIERGAPREIVCPATLEGGSRTDCSRCKLCNGARGPDDARASIRVADHGPGSPARKRKRAGSAV